MRAAVSLPTASRSGRGQLLALPPLPCTMAAVTPTAATATNVATGAQVLALMTLGRTGARRGSFTQIAGLLRHRGVMTDFEEYVSAQGQALLRFAYALCRDADLAQDLVQDALVRSHRGWHRIDA